MSDDSWQRRSRLPQVSSRLSWEIRRLAVGLLGCFLLLAPVACDSRLPDGAAEPALSSPAEPGVSREEGSGDPPEVLGLGPQIASVNSGGWWTDDDDEGFYRVVLEDRGFEHVVSKVWVQWIEISPVGGAQRIRETADIEELNGAAACKLEIHRLLPTAEGVEIELVGQNSYTTEAVRFVLRAGAPGIWTLESPT